MKRSEMIEEIESHFDAHVYLERHSRQSAEFLLNKLEQFGMLPPKQEKSWPKNNPENSISWRMWEPEDEKK